MPVTGVFHCPDPPFTNITAYLAHHGYRMGKVIGEGSYSKVKMTTRFFSNGTAAYKLACKIIDKKKASEEFVKKFLPRELQIVGRLEHPNIVRVYDVVEFDNQVYIFMDLCDKGDLLDFIKTKGQLSENRSRHYFRQLLSAVNYLHTLDIAHRDLKCENILLGPRDILRISDFGFARYCRDDNGKRTLSNTYCGSAAYAGPEILQGVHYNPKLHDMWSLGCVLFIMLTGHMPFDESNIPKMLHNQLERKLTYPSGVEETISDPPKRLIDHLLEPDVTCRATIKQIWNNEWLKMPLRSSMIFEQTIKPINVNLGAGDGAEVCFDQLCIPRNTSGVNTPRNNPQKTPRKNLVKPTELKKQSIIIKEERGEIRKAPKTATLFNKFKTGEAILNSNNKNNKINRNESLSIAAANNKSSVKNKTFR